MATKKRKSKPSNNTVEVKHLKPFRLPYNGAFGYSGKSVLEFVKAYRLSDLESNLSEGGHD